MWFFQRIGKQSIVITATLLFILFTLPAQAQTATFLVTSTGNGADNNLNDGICDGDAVTPGAQCTLRAAIQNANDIPGHDVIEFASGITSIPVSGVLPDITDPLTIDGSTQGGFVELDGSNASGGSTIYDPIGFDILAGDSIVRGMVINRFITGIRLVNGGGNLVVDNRIGTDIFGTADLGNVLGILILSDDNIIDSNLVSANNIGIDISGSNAFGNHLWNNLVGVDISGAVALGNSSAGVNIGDADGNFVGGALAGQGNVISGNDKEGIKMRAANATANGNVIQGNIIGLNQAGTAVVANGLAGIQINSTTNTVIGGGGVNAGNVISGNGSHGIALHSSTGAVVQGNRIGTDTSGMIALGNGDDGLNLASGNSHLIGGVAASEGNLISGNVDNGVDLGNQNVVLQHNIIGLNATGTAVVGNGSHGIRLGGSSHNNVIGGVGVGNVIAGNAGHGIYIQGAINNPTGNQVKGNFIGTNAAGTAVLGNLGDGINHLEGDNNQFGGALAGEGNLVGGNGGSGIVIDGVNASGNSVLGNAIGTDFAGQLDLGNSSHGVLIDTGNTAIGGSQAGAGNLIAFNGGDGIAMTSGARNPIWQNSIFANGGLGIDLGDDGLTLNDLGDSDGGVNRGQNFPVLTAVANSSISGTLFSENNNDYRLEFFASSSCDPSQHGEGETFLGMLTVSIGSTPVDFTLALPTSVADGQFVTATATDISGTTFNDTSEFSRCLPVPTPPSNAIFWANPAGGNWNNPNNWSPALVPDADSDVFITLDGSYAVTLDIHTSVNSLTLGGSSGTQTLQLINRNLTLAADSTVGANGRLEQTGGSLSSGNLTLDGDFVQNSGNVTSSNLVVNGLFVHQNGTLTAANVGVNGRLDHNNGTFSSGDMTVNGTLGWAGGTMSGSGTTMIANSGLLEISGTALKTLSQRTINNNGAATWTGSGTVNMSSDAIFNNNGLFVAQNDALLDLQSGSLTTFNNNGTFRKSGSSGTTTVDVKLNSSGTVEVQSGTLLLTRTGGSSSGSFDLAAGAVAEWRASSYTFDSGTSFTGTGTARIGSGTVTVNDTLIFPGTLEQLNGTLKGAGDITISGSYVWAAGGREGPGTTHILPGATMTLTSSTLKDLFGQTINNDGTIIMDGSGTLRFRPLGAASSVLNNNGLFDAQVDGLLDLFTGAGTAVNNSGTFRKSGGSGSTTVDVLFNNSGTVEAQSGTIHFTRGFNQNGGSLLAAGGELTFAQPLNLLAGSLGGSGTVNGNVVNGATVAPGFSPGQLTINGDYQQTSAGNLNIEIGGTVAGSDFDRLDITGQAILAGSLNISLVNGFVPPAGSSFTILTFASRVGDFDTVTGLALGNGRSFQLVYDATSLSLVVPPNSPPNAVDDTAATDEDTAVMIDVLANDSDSDGDALSISSVTQPANGVVLNNGSDVVYTPNANFNGSDSFSYTIDDGNGATDSAVVTVTITAVNDSPAAVADDATTLEDTAITLEVLSNDSDVDGDSLTIDSTTLPSFGSVVATPTSVDYLPNPDFCGSDAFSYTVSDGNGGSATAAVSVTVTCVNDAPVAVADEATTEQETAVTINVLANDSDVDGDGLTVTAVGAAGAGMAVINPDNSITYTPNAGFSGVDSFTYTVSDGQGGVETAVVTVTVTAISVACDLYPIALHSSSLDGIDPGTVIDDILNGSGSGNFGWLTWTGDTSVPALVASLTPPSNSDTYINPNDPADHSLDVGDWVAGKPGVSNAKAVRRALDNLLGVDIVVPVWDTAQGNGANATYQVAAFAQVQLLAYQLPGQNRLSVVFQDFVSCDVGG